MPTGFAWSSAASNAPPLNILTTYTNVIYCIVLQVELLKNGVVGGVSIYIYDIYIYDIYIYIYINNRYTYYNIHNMFILTYPHIVGKIPCPNIPRHLHHPARDQEISSVSVGIGTNGYWL
jgi:hypothetical protein